MQKPERLYSLDALRGFDMLWITGGPGIIHGLSVLTGWGMFAWLEGQMDHVPWEGFTFYDMIFPLFLFVAGVSFPYSVHSRRSKGQDNRTIYRHMYKRLFLLIILGMVYNGCLQLDFDHMRFASVLARIGIAWFLAAVIYLNFSLRAQVIWFWGILFGYWAMMMWIPVPGYGAGVLTLDGNLAGYVDRLLLPGAMYLKVMDPEGILSHLPAVATAMLGIFTGQFLMRELPKFDKQKKGLTILGVGVVLYLTGMAWGSVFPIIKNIWTSSYVLYAGGLSLILLGIFYLIIDVWGYRKWAFFFAVIGLNSITIYIVQEGIINFGSMRDFLFGGIIAHSPEMLQPLVGSSAYVVCVWLFLYFLFRKKIFLKV